MSIKKGQQLQIPGFDWFEGDFRPSKVVGSALRNKGYDPSSFAATRVDPDKMLDLGTSVRDQMSSDAPMSDTLRSSYESLRGDINDQYNMLTSPTEQGGMGLSVEWTPDDPYETPWAIRDDIDNNRRLRVMDTAAHPDQAHSVFTPEENNRFRAVHDVFGHVGTGRNFSRHGEEAAYQLHSQMVRPESQDALRSETQMQNSYLNYTGGQFPANRPYETPAPKKSPGLKKPGEQLRLV